jgi:hypothetical protein
MPEPRRHPGPEERERLVACLRDVAEARAHLQASRHQVAHRWEKNALRSELLAALEGYAGAIVKLGAPVPIKLRSEIELYRRLGNRG